MTSHPEAAEGDEQREGRIERRVGDNVADFVRYAHAAILPMIARQHTVHGVERHADEDQIGMSKNGQRAATRRDDRGYRDRADRRPRG